MTVDPGNQPTSLLDLIRWVVTDFDPLEALDLVSDHCVTNLPAVAGGILLIDHSGSLQLAGASDHSAKALELFQLDLDRGPCVQCCRTGAMVVDTELSNDGPWPELAREATDRGYTSIYALPLTSRGVVLGALNLFCDQPLEPAALVLATTLADIATVMVLQTDPRDEHLLRARTLRRILEARATLEQATGVLAVRYAITSEEARDRLRWAAEEGGLTISSIAEQIVAGLAGQSQGHINDHSHSSNGAWLLNHYPGPTTS
jgi:hypothetical protein